MEDSKKYEYVLSINDILRDIEKDNRGLRKWSMN